MENLQHLQQIFPFPELTEEEFKELKDDIRKRGVMVPVEIDTAGHIIDGFHRLKACHELGITDVPTVCRDRWTEEEKLEQAFMLNSARRHLSQAQKHEMVCELLKRTPEKSDRKLADTLGVSNSTVSLARKAMEKSGELCESHSSIGADGKERPRNFYKKSAASEQAFERFETDKAKECNHEAPRTMTASEDLLMALYDEAGRLDKVLNVLLDDFQGDSKTEKMLFSKDGIAVSGKGLNAFMEVINKYEKIISSRKHESKPSQNCQGL